MCGINGIIANTASLSTSIALMNAKLAHRGPNDEGVWINKKVALGHRRLSIIDLSSAGHQPMISSCGRYVIVYNGEIYNYSELRTLVDYPYKSHSDTEVVLALWSKMGLECLNLLKGMFAFAIHDQQEEVLTVVRDRLGIKPLYWYNGANGFTFSSEIRALLASGMVAKNISPKSLVDYLRYQTVQAPDTIIEGVQMLLPGHILTYNSPTGELNIQCYWNLFEKGNEPIQQISYQEAKAQTRDLFFKAVERRLVADVPFGAFLSGGIDSSAVVGAMAKFSSSPIKTFNISFAEEEFSEARYARYISQLHHTNHHEINLTPQDFLKHLPDALKSMDHPSGDGPNSWIVSKFTKEAGIDMALSGLGGDELFAGYDVFKRMNSLNNNQWIWKLPTSLRKAAGNTLKKINPGVASDKLSRLISTPHYRFEENYAITRQSLSDSQIALLLSYSIPTTHLPIEYLSEKLQLNRSQILSTVSQAEMSSYMQNVLLRDADQMSMAHALEVRVPFLDHELVEFVLSLPDSIKYPHSPKKLLVDSFPELLPNYIVNRKKMGFVLPWKEWLKNELYNYANDRIDALGKRPYFNAPELKNLWLQFNNNHPEVTFSRIWPLVVLEEWLMNNEIN